MTVAAGSAPTHPASLRRRLVGLGSVFGKTIRDSRRATLLVGGLMALTLVAVSQAIIGQFSTVEARRELEAVIAAVPPILQGLAGRVVNVDTLGGYVQYKYGTFFPLVVSLWSILALSGTLAAEARRGSLEFVATAPISRRRIALQKVAGHLVGMTVAMLLVFVGVLVSSVGSTLPGDEIPPSAAAGFALWLGLLALSAGALAFALAQFFGRGAAVGIAGSVMFAGFLFNGYQFAIPAIAPLAGLTWFGWTANHIPLSGLYDWPSLIFVAILVVVLFLIGVEAFVRRDIGATSAIPSPSLPRALVGLTGPARRAFGAALPSTLAWGLGIGIFGLAIAGSGQSFVDELNNAPDFMRLLQTVFPNVDIVAVGGFLQLLFLQFGLILAGLAAATLVGVWAGDETSGRLEFLLATPLSRARWVVAGGLGLLAGVIVVAVMSAIGIAIGATITAADIATPVLGTAVIGLYAAAWVGVGVAFGGLVGTRLAGAFVAVLTIVTWALDTLAPALGLPDWVRDLALTSHYGLPMLGVWDPVGIVVSLVLAVGGIAIGAWGLGRRDLSV